MISPESVSAGIKAERAHRHRCHGATGCPRALTQAEARSYFRCSAHRERSFPDCPRGGFHRRRGVENEPGHWIGSKIRSDNRDAPIQARGNSARCLDGVLWESRRIVRNQHAGHWIGTGPLGRSSSRCKCLEHAGRYERHGYQVSAAHVVLFSIPMRPAPPVENRSSSTPRSGPDAASPCVIAVDRTPEPSACDPLSRSSARRIANCQK